LSKESSSKATTPKGSNKKTKAPKIKTQIVTIQDDRDTEDPDDDDDDDEGGTAEEVSSRRQKRLERNRESARLSRRRRKQYLEILEDRVTQLSTEVDQGRRAHAAQAVTITLHKRREIMEAPEKTNDEKVQMLQHGLGRTSAEMMLVTTFKYQQLRSFSLPAQNKFILWLTLQNDQYFRGGRAASERLSAARIGERVSTKNTKNCVCIGMYSISSVTSSCSLDDTLPFYSKLFRCSTAETTGSLLLSPCGLCSATKLDCPMTRKKKSVPCSAHFSNRRSLGWSVTLPELRIWQWPLCMMERKPFRFG